MDDRNSALRRFERRVDREIADLEKAGELRGLTGEGRPLLADPDADAGDAWAARHLMRAAQASPPWAELRREVMERRARLVGRLRAHVAWLARRETLLHRVPAERIVSEVEATRDADERVRRELRSAVEELNVLVRKHNLMVSAAALHLRIATVEELMEIAQAHRR